MRRSTLIGLVMVILLTGYTWYIGSRENSWAFIHDDIGALLLVVVATFVTILMLIRDGISKFFIGNSCADGGNHD